MSKIFSFGESHPAYPVPVINEREARAGAGILFVFAIVAFMNAWFKGDFAPTKLVIVAFFADFFTRVVVNPRYSPSLILGRFAVRNQIPEYVGAPQKRFAWGIGLALATLMLFLVVFNNVRGPINILVCGVCLFLLFFETAFGICVGCKLYNLVNRERAQLCPGGVCEVKDRQPIQFVSASQWGVFLVFVAVVLAMGVTGLNHGTQPRATGEQPDAAAGASPTEIERCRVPEFAKKIGHEEQWKLHNGCK